MTGKLTVESTPLEGLKVVTLNLLGDERGFFVERFNRALFREHQLPCDFVQDNHSRSAPGILRGLHFQLNPGQGKLVGVIRGAIWDVAVDIRRSSPTFGQHFAITLSDLKGQLLWLPAGFAHGFCVLGTEPADVFYKVDQFYHPSAELGCQYNDPSLAIPWPIVNPTLSRRDQGLPTLAALGDLIDPQPMTTPTSIPS